MGKRKSAKKPVAKKKLTEKIANAFQCPFCSQQKCEATVDKLKKTAYIRCGDCQEDFKTTAHALTEPIDVYNDWIDACEEANQ